MFDLNFQSIIEASERILNWQYYFMFSGKMLEN